MTKQLLYLPVFALFLLFSLQCSSQNKGAINGEGEIVKKEISLADINGFDFGLSGDVILTQGSPQKIVLEGQQNIIDNITQEVKNGWWHIGFIKNVRNSKNITIHLTVQDINKVALTGSGSVRAANKFTGLDDVELDIRGSGNIVFDYEANATDASLTGSGTMKLSGNSNRLNVSITGSGDVMAGDLVTESCDVDISGSGNATVNASNKLATDITGSGDVRYSGNASVDAHVTGSGQVSKIQQ